MAADLNAWRALAAKEMKGASPGRLPMWGKAAVSSAV